MATPPRTSNEARRPPLAALALLWLPVARGASLALATDSAAAGGHRLLAPRLDASKLDKHFLSLVQRPKVRGLGNSGRNTSQERLERLNPFAEAEQVQVFECGPTYKASSKSFSRDRCPEACPYFAQDKLDTAFCTFSCVQERQCATMNPATQIGDKELGICRSCMIDGCNECDTSVAHDRCKTCAKGYILKEDGLCYFKYGGTPLYVVGGVLGVVVLLVLAWVADMALRPTCNAVELRHAEASRHREKIHMDADASGHRHLWPFGTNLHSTMVAGPGMLLHFNFQLAIIVWALFVAVVWISFASLFDADLFFLGTRPYGTPRDICILVAWGYETQQRLMWTKVAFLWIVYIVSFLLSMVYGVFQLRKFQNLDAATTTMKDFAAMLVGIQGMQGSRRVEEELKNAVEAATGQTVVGVSVAWDHKNSQELVLKALDKDLDELLEANEIAQSPKAPLPEMGGVRKALYQMEQKVFQLPGEEEEEKLSDEDIKLVLLGLQSAQRAVVVFESEDARDYALERAAGGIELEGLPGRMALNEIFAEPDSVQWEHFGHSSQGKKTVRILLGFGAITLACLFWAVVFYAPYAYYVLTFDYGNGRQPGFAVAMSFSMIVVIGNAIMYEVCARVSDWVGFRFRDNREACYMILYTVACMFNVLLDFVTTYMTQDIVLTSLGFRTYTGEKLSNIHSFSEKFETYGMQRALAENAFTYAWPSTFLIPFLIEWMPTMFLPWFLGRLIVKNHPEVRGHDAEEWLQMIPTDMGRYADILLNVILGILIFYFPGGYTWSLFLGMAGSHLFIYGFDYYKVLRQIPHVDYVSFDVEWWCQAMLAPILAIMASCLAFKSNCEPGYHCLEGSPLVLVCTAAFVAHAVLHLLALVYVVPKFGKEIEKHPELEVPFWHCAQHIPASWFTANPVHCLRSKYIYEHSPPCDYCYSGKESLMRENADIGCHFKHRAKAFKAERSARDDAELDAKEAEQVPTPGRP